MYRPETLPIRVDLFEKKEGYKEAVDRVAKHFDELIKDEKNKITHDESMYLSLKRGIPVDGIQELWNILAPQMIATVYGRNITASATFHRTPKVDSKHFKETKASDWEWHTDNFPNWNTKILIYLVDVTEKTAPFEYLIHKVTGEPKKIPYSIPPYYPESRVPKYFIENCKKNGYTTEKIIGKKGTHIIFDNNIIHTKNLAEDKDRDVVIFTISPQPR